MYIMSITKQKLVIWIPEDFILKLIKSDLKFFCVSETSLHEYIKNDDMRIPGYSVFRKDRTTSVWGGVCVYIEETMHVNIRADLMFENIEAIWSNMGTDTTRWYQTFSIMYVKTPSATTEYYEKNRWHVWSARMTEHPVLSLGDLNFNHILDETLSTHPISYIWNCIWYAPVNWPTNTSGW